MKSKKKPPQFAARKKAFDRVLEAYRDAKDAGGIGAIAMGDRGKGVSNPARPSLTDFRCDVSKVVNKCVTNPIDRLRFQLAYIEFDSESSIECEMFAEKIIGSSRHGLEQGCGAEFIKRGIYPLHGNHGYFHTLRQPRGKV